MLRDNFKYRFGRWKPRKREAFEELAGYCYSNEMLQQISSISLDDALLPNAQEILAIAFGEAEWSLGIAIPSESLGENIGWNDPVRMQDPIISRDLSQLIYARLGVDQ